MQDDGDRDGKARGRRGQCACVYFVLEGGGGLGGRVRVGREGEEGRGEVGVSSARSLSLLRKALKRAQHDHKTPLSHRQTSRAPRARCARPRRGPRSAQCAAGRPETRCSRRRAQGDGCAGGAGAGAPRSRRGGRCPRAGGLRWRWLQPALLHHPRRQPRRRQRARARRRWRLCPPRAGARRQTARARRGGGADARRAR